MAGEKRDLVVSPGAYAYMRDGTKGTIKVFSGPTVVTPSAQDEGIIYDEKAGDFKPCAELSQALRKSPVTVEGFYCVLLNPAKNRKQPDEGGQSTGTDLDVGRKIVIPGPAMFALWPGQSAEVIRGHQLRSNQYLIARVYNEEEAKRNWSKAVVKPASPLVPPPATAPQEEQDAYQVAIKAEIESRVATAAPPKDLSVGRLLIIRGTEVSFYIPPTGISVVAEGVDEVGRVSYVREALTLERLEYAILIGENGEKRYTNGPTVVFPAPTERFMEGKTDEGQVSRKFKAIEMNPLQGLHLKVIADYEENGTKYTAGQELFITGKDTAIYYPREEVSAIKYDGKTKHFATAVPVGEGRYVLNRMSGEINTEKGPNMLLPDPRTEVIVRRVLTDRQAQDWYPGNAEALEYNRNLREILKQVPTTRGAPSEGDIERNYSNERKTKGGLIGAMTKGAVMSSNAASYMIADSSRVSKEQAFVGDEFVRGSTFTQPRSVTLDTKYQGVPTVEIWTGYAVLVVSKSGDKRRVVEGPSVVLLDYDESFEAITLSTGKPKNTAEMLRTIFLRTANNQVTDLVQVETSDYVQFNLRLGYRVNFEGDSSKWWNVENYVKFLCDRMRSDLKGAVKKLRFEDFRPHATEILQGLILQAPSKPGEGTPKGRLFPENGMRVTDVEVLAVDCLDASIEGTFKQSALSEVKTLIELNQLKRGLEVTREKESVIREETEVRALTLEKKNEITIALAMSDLSVARAKLDNELKRLETVKDLEAANEELKNFTFDQELSRQKLTNATMIEHRTETQELALQALKAEAAAVATRFVAAKDGLSEIARVLENTGAAVEIAKAMNMQRAIGGESFAEAASKVLSSIPALAPLLQKVAPSNGQMVPSNGSSEKKPSLGA